jgi:hypothetical protein
LGTFRNVESTLDKAKLHQGIVPLPIISGNDQIYHKLYNSLQFLMVTI